MIKFSKIKNDKKKYFNKLINVFKCDKDIISLYLFGSYAKNTVKPLSDIDLAVLLNTGLSKEKYGLKRIELLNKAIDVLRTDEIDLIILNQAPPLQGFQIIKYGRILFCKDETKRINMQVHILNRYFDILPMINEYNKYLHKRIKEGKFGARYKINK